MKLQDMQDRLVAADESLRECGLNEARSVLGDLIDIVEALVHREAARVPIRLDKPAPMPTTVAVGPMRMARIAKTPTLETMTDAQIDRFFPRGTVVNHYYVRRDFELYQPHPEQPSLFSIRRKRTR